MDQSQKYVIASLELHLFFARIMKEHSLFLEAGFTPPDISYAREAECYKVQFEHLLTQAVRLSDGIIRPQVLNSGEILTEFTFGAEQQTQCLTGIAIDRRITEMESRLRFGVNPCISQELLQKTKMVNQTAIDLLNGLIDLKERILENVLACRMFTVNYPLLIEHIIREAKLYRMYLINFETGRDLDCQSMKQVEQFWNQIMMEHALFIRGLLDPTEDDLIQTSDSFARDYARLLEESKKQNDLTIKGLTEKTLEETIKFRDFKHAGAEGITECNIRSIILPLLADHVLREANHYIRLLAY